MWKAPRRVTMRKRSVPERWLFPGTRAGKPMTTANSTACSMRRPMRPGFRKGVTLHALRHSFATHLLEDGTDIRFIQALLGQDKLDTTARYTRVATGMIAGIESPLDRLSQPRKDQEEQEGPAAGVTAGSCVASSAGGRGYLRDHGAAWRRAMRPRQLGQLKVMSAIERCRTAALVRPCRALREVRAHPDLVNNSCRQPALARSAKAQPPGVAGRARAISSRCRTFHVVYTLPAQIADIAYQNKTVIYDLRSKPRPRHAHDRGRCPSIRRSHRLHLGAPHLGLRAHPPPHVHMVVPGGGLSPDDRGGIRVPPTLFF